MYLVVVMAGWRRTLEVLPAVVICGVSFAAVQFYVSNFMGPELTDILSSLSCIGAMVLVLKLWKPPTIFRLEGEQPAPRRRTATRPGEVCGAWLPYMLLVVFVLVWGEVAGQAGDRQLHQRPAAVVPAAERDGAQRPERAGPAQPRHARAAGDAGAGALRRRLHAQLAEQRRARPASWRRSSSRCCLRVSPRSFAGVYRATFAQLAKPMLTIASMLALAYLMNYSGMTSTLGIALAATGRDVSVLQRDPRLAGRVPDRQRHVGQCAVRQPADDHREPDRAQPGADHVGQLRRRRHGQDDRAPEHRRRRRRDRA